MNARALRHLAEYALFRAVVAALGACPEGAALRLGSAVGWLTGSLMRVRRADVDAHLRIAFPDRPEEWRRAVAVASYRHLGREAAVLARLAEVDPSRLRSRLLVEGLDAVREAVTGGRGVVVATGHLGNWEVGALALTSLDVPVYAVAKPLANRRVDAWLRGLRERMGLRLLDPGDAPAHVPAVLNHGGVVAFVADQDAHERGVFVPFFGRSASTPGGPATLALRAAAPLFLAVAVAEAASAGPARYRVSFEPVEAARTGSVEGDVRRVTEAYTAALERRVRERPGQYFWQHRRWKTRPAGSGTQEQASGGPV